MQDKLIYINKIKNELKTYENLVRSNQIQIDFYGDIIGRYKLSELYKLKRIQNKCVTRFKNWLTRLYEIHSETDLNPMSLIQEITELQKEAEMALITIMGVEPTDSISKVTDVVFTGFNGVMWYETPLKIFVTRLAGNEIQTSKGVIKINNMKDMLFVVNDVYKNADVITVIDWTIPKSSLIYFIQQLLIIENATNKDTRHLSPAEKRAKHERIDRAIHKIHSDLQIPPNMLSIIIQYFEYLNCGASCVMTRSSKEFFKGKLPEWVNHVIAK